MSEISVTNITGRTVGVGRSLGYAVGEKTFVVEDGETVPIPLTPADPRIAADKAAGLIEIKAQAAPPKSSSKSDAK